MKPLRNPLILYRYILGEHIGPFFFSISIITLIFLLNLVFRELGRFLSRGLGLGVMFEFFFLNIAWIIALSVPMSVLVATLMAFGRLAGDNEITALKSGGVSILQLLTPILLASALLSLGLIFFNNHILPDFNHRARLLAMDIARKRPTISIEAGVFFHGLKDYSLLVQEIQETPDTSFVKSIFIEDNSKPGSVTTIVADSGKIYFDRTRGLLFFILFHGQIHELDLVKMEDYRILSFPKQILSIPVADWKIQRSESEHRGDREKSAQTMLTDVRRNRLEIEKERKRVNQLASSYIFRYLPLSFRPQIGFTQDQIEYRLKQPLKTQVLSDHVRFKQDIVGARTLIRGLEKQNASLMVEVHKKYSIPVACIIFVLIGAPLGIMGRKGNAAVAAGVSFGFFLLYWAALIGGEELADNQYISPVIAMWGANMLVGLGGIYLVVHSIREATVIDWNRFGRILRSKVKRKSDENIG
ncbi:LptF/LptG family permease [candidate division KSB1 bacterium]|nr:LptF/LptG family permease [candidate division KSB1 bacterium]